MDPKISRNFQRRSKISRDVQKPPETFRNLQRRSEISRDVQKLLDMYRNIQRRSETSRNVHKPPETFRNLQRFKNIQRRSETSMMFEYAQKYSRTIKDAQVRPEMLKNDAHIIWNHVPKRPEMLRNDPKLLKKIERCLEMTLRCQITTRNF